MQAAANSERAPRGFGISVIGTRINPTSRSFSDYPFSSLLYGTVSTCASMRVSVLSRINGAVAAVLPSPARVSDGHKACTEHARVSHHEWAVCCPGAAAKKIYNGARCTKMHDGSTDRRSYKYMVHLISICGYIASIRRYMRTDKGDQITAMPRNNKYK
jgi:hypothetical protein